jgi:hypothetical protein
VIAACISNESSQYALTPGVSYLVLGISVIANDEACRVLYQVLNDSDGISHVPAGLLDLQDSKCSAFWIARYDADGSLLLWPKEFFVDYFHDDLSEGDGAVANVFRGVVDKLKEEAGM